MFRLFTCQVHNEYLHERMDNSWNVFSVTNISFINILNIGKLQLMTILAIIIKDITTF